MQQLRSLLQLLAAIMVCAGWFPARAQPAKPGVTYDQRSLIINGKPQFIYSGAFHYFRCPRALWRKRFETIKAAGCNTVETYIPWNRHEKRMPKSLRDFSGVDLSEFGEWLKMAESFGFYVIIRPGPFICAEYDRGGYPGWLTTLRPKHPRRWMWYRSDDPVYLEWAAHWMQAACRFIAPHQVGRRAPGTGGVILVQVENEYSHVYFPAEAKLAALRSLVKTALAAQIHVPLVACESPEISANQDTLIRNHVIETNNFYPNNDIRSIRPYIDTMRKVQPLAPLMVTELQGGWFTYVWNAPTFQPGSDHYAEGMGPAQLQNLVLYGIQNGETLLNYYMLFGGTSLAGTEGKNMQSSYDYSAPIRENGGTGEKYARVKAIGRFLQQYGGRLIASGLDSTIRTTIDQPGVEVAERVTPAGERFIFVRNNDAALPQKGRISLTDRQGTWPLDYELGPLGSAILYLPAGATHTGQGHWYPEVHHANPSATPPICVPVKFTQSLPAGPASWRPLKPGRSLLQAGIYDNRSVYYRASFRVNDPELIRNGGLLRVTYPQLDFNALKSGHGLSDEVIVCLKGKRLKQHKGGLYGDFEVPAATLKQGDNEFILLYENTGYAIEFVYMEKQAGITGLQLIRKSATPVEVKDWRQLILTADDRLITPAQPDTTGEWQTIKASGTPAAGVPFRRRGIFKTILRITPEDVADGRTAIWFSQLGDVAWVYLNGRLIGESTSRIESRLFDLRPALRNGANQLMVVADNYDRYAPGGIGQTLLTQQASASIPPQKMWLSDAAGSASKRATIQPDSLLSWQTYHFRLRKAKGKTWILRLPAGQPNRQLFLNGHAIGRYWKDGLQTDYYLPECWLRQGTNKSNNITMLVKNDPIIKQFLSCTVISCRNAKGY